MVAPLIQQSGSRLKNLASTIRRQQFITKTEIGPQTIQAITEGELEQGRLEAQEQSRQALTAKLERERIAAEKERTQQFAIAARKERKAQEESTLEKAANFVGRIFST
jgi:hypothetical protein